MEKLGSHIFVSHALIVRWSTFSNFPSSLCVRFLLSRSDFRFSANLISIYTFFTKNLSILLDIPKNLVYNKASEEEKAQAADIAMTESLRKKLLQMKYVIDDEMKEMIALSANRELICARIGMAATGMAACIAEGDDGGAYRILRELMDFLSRAI